MSNDAGAAMLPMPEQLYILNSSVHCGQNFEKVKQQLDFFTMYRVDEITFEDKAPRKEALENVISSMNICGINFIYAIIGTKQGVSFYYGVAKDFSFKGDTRLEISDIGDSILKPSLQGNFRGSRVTELDPDSKRAFLQQIDRMNRVDILEGVPGVNKDDENFQAVDRIVDVMLGDEFALLLIAKPVASDDISKAQQQIYSLYDTLGPQAKTSKQENSGMSDSRSTSETNGTSKTEGTNSSSSEQRGTGTSESSNSGTTGGTSRSTSKTNTKSTSSNSTAEGVTEGSNDSWSRGTSSGTSTSMSKSTSVGTSASESTNNSHSTSTQTGTSTGRAVTTEIINKNVQDWIKYLDEIILPRLDYGMGKGVFIASTILLGREYASLVKLKNTIRSVYGGESGNRMPLCGRSLEHQEQTYVKRLQIPMLEFASPRSIREQQFRIACTQWLPAADKLYMGNWMSSKEMSLLAGLPQKEVVGLALREEVEFGLNVKCRESNAVLLGHMVQSGAVLNGQNGTPNIPVYFDKTNFDKHIFVTGVTGSGKTTTCQKLLLESKQNFLVIEPAKTEYRALGDTFDDLLVFTLGKETGAPFRLNPFEFFPSESITSRVDLIMASMEAAFDMEAAIPQLLESAIYSCYEKKGWNIATNRNKYYASTEEAFASADAVYPTLSQLNAEVEKVVDQQGFDDRLRAEYIGSIRARLKGLTVGAKGLMLDTPRSINFEQLLDRKVVIEMENIKSGTEKSLIMGFILSNLSEAIKRKYTCTNRQIDHITLVEEAHRLLSKYVPGDSMNKKQGVEVFADMLAEVRKYGEALIIADQIPNKLTPEVLKNTNTKIVHKIFAQDDKEAIGNTMALKDEQKEFLSYLDAGRAVMVQPGLNKAVQIQIQQSRENDTERVPPEDSILRKRILRFYRDTYQQGILPGLEKLTEKPDEQMIELYFECFSPRSEFIRTYRSMISNPTENTDIHFLKKLLNRVQSSGLLSMFIRMTSVLLHNTKYSKAVEPEIERCFRSIMEAQDNFRLCDAKDVDHGLCDDSLLR